MDSLIARDRETMMEIGLEIGRQLRPGDVLSLVADLGGGKTTLTKGIVSGYLGIEQDEVTSPAFALVQEYEGSGNNVVYHIDWYRLEAISDHDHLMFEEYFEDKSAVIIVEWGDKGVRDFTNDFLKIEIDFVDTVSSEARLLKIEKFGNSSTLSNLDRFRR